MTNRMDSYRRRPGFGFRHPRSPEMRLVTVAFDLDTIEEMRRLAVKNRISLSEQIRRLVEWGLEA